MGAIGRILASIHTYEVTFLTSARRVGHISGGEVRSRQSEGFTFLFSCSDSRTTRDIILNLYNVSEDGMGLLPFRKNKGLEVVSSDLTSVFVCLLITFPDIVPA